MDDGLVVHGQPFAVVPEGLLYANVSDRAVRLWCVLQRHVNMQAGGTAYPGRERLASLLGCSTDSIDRATRELVQIRALKKLRRRRADGTQTSSEYHLLYDLPAGSRAARVRTGRAAQVRTGPSRKGAARTTGSTSSNERVATPTASPRAAATAGSSEPVRKRDLLWDAFDEFMGAPTNDQERGRRGKALKAVRQSLDAEGVGDEQMQAAALRQRLVRARDTWGANGLTYTEMAIATNWRLLGAQATAAYDPANLSAAQIMRLAKGEPIAA